MRRIVITALIALAVPLSSSATQAAIVSSNQTWSLTAVGDIMLDRYVWTNIKKYGLDYPFKKIAPSLKGSDVVLANLEGPFTTSSRHAVNGNTLTFTFDPALASTLRQSGLIALSLANNHTLNQGQRGLDSTRTTLKRAGLEYFGDPRNRTNYQLTKTINGQRVTFIGYHGLVAGLETVLSDVRRAQANGQYVVIMAHEGIEYHLKYTAKQQQDYRRLIDAGADLVLSAHPHVVEPLEVYKGKLIAYSLGNFVFDQYFSAATQQELMLKIVVGPSSLTVNLIPLMSVRSQVSVAAGAVKTAMLNRIANDSAVTAAVRNGIRQGTFTIAK